MEKLKVAILEDNQELLKELYNNLKETDLVDIIIWETNSTEFLEKIKSNPVDALILDIDLNGDSMSGIDVANRLKLPVLFASGKTKEYITEIESINLDSEIPVEHITKPISFGKLKKILPKFISQIELQSRAKYVYLDFKDRKRTKIRIDSIVFLETDTGESGKSNNKIIYFTDRKPEVLIDFSFSKMHEKGFETHQFTISKQSHRVNINHVDCYNKADDKLIVKARNKNDELINFSIPVSENYRSAIKKMFR